MFFEDLPRLLDGDGALALALSGGGDSAALLALALEARRRSGLRLIAATVDHGLRPEARAEAEEVARLCAERGVPHRILTWAGAKPEANLQAAAREARLALLREWRAGEGVRGLALGHTLDDAAETFLMRLARGSGVDGLSRMAPRRAERAEGAAEPPGVAGPYLIRPLLRCRRADLRAVCRRAGLGWIEDPSNAEDRFLRVRARRALEALAPLGLEAERLAETAGRLGRAREALAAEAAALLGEAAAFTPALGLARLSAAPLRAAPEELALRALARLLEWASGAAYPPRLEKLEAALGAIFASESGRTLHGASLVRVGEDDWAIFREPAAAAEPVPIGPGGALWDRRFVCGPAPRAGLRLGALGEVGAAMAARRLEAGEGRPPAAWRAAPLAARRAAPAILSASGAAISVPAAGLIDPEAPEIRPARRPPAPAAESSVDR